MKEYYTTWGPSRGWCGHKHSTMVGAIQCIDRDHKGESGQNDYFSDRRIRICTSPDDLIIYDINNGPGRCANEEEDAYIEEIYGYLSKLRLGIIKEDDLEVACQEIEMRPLKSKRKINV